MSKYFEIEGYWKDDKSEINGYIVKEYDDAEQDEQADDEIFEYGWSETDLKEAIAVGENTMLDFVITSYKEIVKREIIFTLNIPLATTTKSATDLYTMLENNSAFTIKRFRVKNNSYKGEEDPIFIVEISSDSSHIPFQNILQQTEADYLMVESDAGINVEVNNKKGVLLSECSLKKFHSIIS
jgi:hypothetical protein